LVNVSESLSVDQLFEQSASRTNRFVPSGDQLMEYEGEVIELTPPLKDGETQQDWINTARSTITTRLKSQGYEVRFTQLEGKIYGGARLVVSDID